MNPEDFLDYVRRAFSPIAERFGFRELRVADDSYVYKAIVFSNGQREVKIYLDVRDGYFDALCSSASPHGADGRVMQPVIHAVKRQWSVTDLLRPEGVRWPTREGGLFEPGVLEKAVDDLISGMERHSQEVFGQTP